MYTMDQIHNIRELFFEQGMSLADIAKTVNCSWRTAKKYIDMEDFSLPVPAPQKLIHLSKLDPFKREIDKWLTEDKKKPRKQRHTARRVHNRLKKEMKGYNCSYRLTANYVAAKKKELNLRKGKGYIPLIHKPGAAQADFGCAEFIENGRTPQPDQLLQNLLTWGSYRPHYSLDCGIIHAIVDNYIHISQLNANCRAFGSSFNNVSYFNKRIVRCSIRLDNVDF